MLWQEGLYFQKGRERVKKLTDRIGREMLFFDGAMGTMLQAQGLPEGTAPDVWNILNPSAVETVHRQYLQAGCHILKTNTFGANALKLKPYGYTVTDVVSTAVSLTKQSIAAEKAEAYVALDIGPTGKLLEPLGDLAFEHAVSLFAEMVKAGVTAGADCILIETMSDSYELKAAVLAAKENSDLPIFCTVVFDENAKLLTGADIAATVALLEGLGVTALGMNCGRGPEAMLPLVEELRACSSLPLIVNPNAGLPRMCDGKTVFDVEPEAFARSMAPIAEKAAFIGGCCGTTPAHLAALVDGYRDVKPSAVPHYDTLTVSSFAKSVTIGAEPVIIGERINPTGKKRFRQALIENDMDYLLREAIAQEESGAHILDVNVGIPDIDEAERLPAAIQALQQVTALPLQLDTADPAAMEKALRLYNGKPLINSVNGKEESLQAVLPLVKKYGGGVVALTLDEDGIPSTAQGRLAIAKRIVERAEALGIDRRNILVDVLTLPVSADDNAAKVTLEALQLVKKELRVKTVLGVSNVSFGLPSRETVNAAFYTMALQAGLDAGIINPNVEAMTKVYDSFTALMGYDSHCERYIARFSAESVAAPVSTGMSLTLKEAVIKGLSDQAASLSQQALNDNLEPLAIINEQLVPALDHVGRGFENGSLFLPQLLMSAQAAKAAFDVIKSSMSTQTDAAERDLVVLATVKGDIHDIGKNIVKVLLENYQFRVLDLGKDVSPETIVDTVLQTGARLVGLSALMTTTVPAMEETIRQLRAACPSCLVMVGGAVMTQEYADRIGADFYGKDAMASVAYAKSVF